MDGERLLFPDSSFYTVVATLVLCTVPSPVRALREMARVCGCHLDRDSEALASAAGLRVLAVRRGFLGLVCAMEASTSGTEDIEDMERMGPVLASRLEREGILIVDRNPGRRWWVEAVARRGRPDGAARRPLSSLAVRERLRSGRVCSRRGVRD